MKTLLKMIIAILAMAVFASQGYSKNFKSKHGHPKGKHHHHYHHKFHQHPISPTYN